MPYQAVTLATLRQRVRDRFESVPFWTTADANQAINEALLQYNLMTGMWKRRVVVNTVLNQVWYTVPSTMVFDVRMEFMGHPIDHASSFAMDHGRPGWEGETTASGGDVPTQPKHWIPKALNLFGIWPADAVGGNSLIVDGVRATPVLVNDADFVDLGREDEGALVDYALHVCAFKEGGARFRGTQALLSNFIRAAADKNTRLRASNFFRRYMGTDVDRFFVPARSIPEDSLQPQSQPGQPQQGSS